MSKIEMRVERTRSGYSAYAAKYSVATTGKNLQELKDHILESLNLYFEEEGRIITEKDLRISLDLPQFFEFYKVINAKALSESIGMNQSLLAQYIGGTKQPSPSQTARILKGIQKIGRELAEIRFLI